MRFRALWAVIIVTAMVILPIQVSGQAASSGVVSQTFSLTATGTGPVLNLNGQNTCSITIYNGSSFSLTAQVASDGPSNPQTWNTATALGSSGVITSVGTSGGNISAAGQGNTNFRFILTSLGTGPLTGVESCTSAGGSGGGTTQTVTVSNTPGVTVQNTPSVIIASAAPIQPITFASSQPVSVSNASPIPVTTPVPLPTAASGVPQVTLCDSTTANRCGTIDTSGNQKVKICSSGGCAVIDPSLILAVNPGSTSKLVLTSGSTTTCTSITTSAGRLGSVINASSTAQSATLTLFDEGASPTCASTDTIYQIVLAAAQVVTLNIPTSNGLAYTLSASLTNNIVVMRN